jgi:DNA invertase Pin-like site-specific DNA recombinase
MDYVNSRKGTAVCFEDPDTSSRIPFDQRTGLCQMLEAIKRNDVVVIARLDRLARDTAELIKICRMIRKKGADFYSIAEGKVDDWLLGIMGSIAQREVQSIRERTSFALQAMSRRGERVGHIPYGYRLQKDIKRTSENRNQRILLEENPQELMTLKEMSRLRADGLSYRKMAEALNKSGFRNRDGQIWSRSAVDRCYSGWIKRRQEYVS